MARIVKKIAQTPNEVRRERKKWLSMERLINVGLQRIDSRYQIRDLIRRPDGTIEFESAVEFNPEHKTRIEHLLSLLEAPGAEFVQVKFYLPRRLQRRVRHLAVDSGVPASSLVAAILAENT